MNLTERFWQRGVPLLQEAYVYGWAPGEHVYKKIDGMLVWDHRKAFHPYDTFMLSYDRQPIGVRVKSIKDSLVKREENKPTAGTVDMWLASEDIPAKAAWYPHRPKFGQFYGRTQLAGAWRPWRRLGHRDAVEQVIDAAIYRAGYRGPLVRYPSESIQTARTGIPGTTVDEAGNPRRNARDAARQIGEYAKAGATIAMSSEHHPTAMGGGYKWDIDWPEHVMDVKPLIEAAKYLEDQIYLGIGVPPELIKAGGTGSGYSGRSIPREAFLDGQQRIADAMLQLFVEQVLRPLVKWNFGDVPFNIEVKPLLKTQADDKQGEQGMGPMGPGGPGQPPQPPTPPPQPQGAPFGIEDEDIDASLGWVTIGGKENPETGEKHEGGRAVLLDKNGNIARGNVPRSW